jgi:hypothetical protein
MKKQRTKARLWSWEAGALCCFGGGILAALIGSVLTALTWFLGAQLHPLIRGTGTALLIATIPLVIFSGYCLDWSEREKSLKKDSGDGRFKQGTKVNDLVRD